MQDLHATSQTIRTDAAIWSQPTKETASLVNTNIVTSITLPDSSLSTDIGTLSGSQVAQITSNANNNVIELNDLASLCKMSRSNHSSKTSSTVSLDAEMNISGSTKTLNSSPYPTMEIDNELINILTLNNHRAGKYQNKPKNYMRILPPMSSRAVEEQDTCDKSALLGKASFSTVK